MYINYQCPARWASSWCPQQQQLLWISAASLLLGLSGCTLTCWPLPQIVESNYICCVAVHSFLLDSKALLTEHKYIWRSLTLMYFLMHTIHIDCHKHLMCPQTASVLPQRSFWRWAEWWPGSVDVAVWRWPAHSQHTGSRRKWQSGQFLHIMFVYIYIFSLKKMEWGCFIRSRSTGQRMFFLPGG